MVRAGLQGDVGGGSLGAMAAGLGIAQGHDLGVRAPGLLGEALADALPTILGHQHAADPRVGVAQANGAVRQHQRTLQVVVVVVRGHRVARGVGFREAPSTFSPL